MSFPYLSIFNDINFDIQAHKKQIHQFYLYKIIFMLEENLENIVSYNSIETDPQLINLFSISDIHPKNIFDKLTPAQQHKDRFGHILVKDAEVLKGYASDESPQKKSKNKKIKKRKTLAPKKIESIKNKSSGKFYIQSLENRIQQLQSQVERLKNLNKVNLDYIKKVNDSQLIINGSLKQRQMLFQKLQILTNSESPDSNRIKAYCQTLQQKQGSYGEDRIKAVQYYFKQLIEVIFTSCHKYLAEVAFKNTDLFNVALIETWQQKRKQLFNQLNLSPEVINSIAQKKEEVIALHLKFNKKILEMYAIKCSLLEISRQIQILYQKMNEPLTPLQTGRLFCFFQKYKFDSNFYIQDSVRKMYQQLSSPRRFSYFLQKHSS